MEPESNARPRIRPLRPRRQWLIPAFGMVACGAIFLARPLPIHRPAVQTVDPNVTTYHNDNARTGQYLAESVLTPANVRVANFGKLFSRPVDGLIQAQPLYVSGVNIPGKGVHNVVYVATQHGSLYAFDADDNSGANAEPLWKVSFINPAAGITTVAWQDVAIDDIVPEIGITGTPVIDMATGTIYLVAKTKEVVNGGTTYYQRLHALDIRTGQPRTGSPVVIGGSAPGTGTGTDGTNVKFFSRWQNQRMGLLLSNNTVHVGFGSHGDNGTYHGWMFSYNASTLQRTGVFCATPNGEGGGTWHGGAAPAVDSDGSLYMTTGDGTFDAASAGGRNYGSSLLRLKTTGGLSVLDHFTPYNQSTVDILDQDFGASGMVLLPESVGSAAHRRLLVTGSKEGRLFLLDRDNLGKFNPIEDSQIVQWLPATALYGCPAYYNGLVYFATSNRPIKAFRVSNALLTGSPVAQTPTTFLWPGTVPSISANGLGGGTPVDGIVWAIEKGIGHGVLHAYDAMDLTKELYNSEQAGNRDEIGSFVKFSVPMIANGKVYVGSGDRLTVFGHGQWVSAPTIVPSGGESSGPRTIEIINNAPGSEIRYTVDGSEPTPASLLYNGPISLTQSATIKAQAYRDGFRPSGVATGHFLIGGSVGTGDGLLAYYFTNNTLTGTPTVTRVDPTVHFNWLEGTSPTTGIPPTNFSVRWSGYIEPRTSGLYTISINTDDGARLYIDNQVVIDSWMTHRELEESVTGYLTAGRRYPIRLDYYQKTRYAVAQLLWSAPGLPKQAIPKSQLYSAQVSASPVKPTLIKFSPSTVLGTAGSTGTVVLDGAVRSDTPMQLISANPAAGVPTTWTIPAGKSEITFPITTSPVSALTAGRIMATVEGISVSANINVRPIGVNALSFRPKPVKGGSQATGTITLEAPAAPGEITVTLSSANPGLASPAVTSVTIPAGSTTGTFKVNTTAVTTATSVTMSATTPGKTKTAPLNITP
ncbi:MAG: PA14 domain-containing protein [Capsulimonadales bacterium]|nr:PA14 domain-containing protein [Capsulimonadales bacterium]